MAGRRQAVTLTNTVNITGTTPSGDLPSGGGDSVTFNPPITYAWQATGQSPVTRTGCLNDTVTFTWIGGLSSTQMITVTASNVGGAVSDTHTIDIAARKIYLPFVLRGS